MKAIYQVIRSEGKFFGIILAYLLAVGILAQTLPIEEWTATINDTGFWFLCAYWGLFLVRGFFFFPPLYFLLTAVLIFDFWEAIWIFMIGILASATLSFLIGWKLNQHPFFVRVRNRAEKSLIFQKMKAHPYRTIILINAMGISFDIPNYMAGYFRLKYVYFFVLILCLNSMTTLFFASVLYPLQQRILG